MRTSLRKSLVVLIAVMAVLLAAGCGSSKNEQSPAEATRAALDKTASIKSGRADITGALAVGNLPGSIALSGGGPFDAEAKGGGAMDLRLTVRIAGSDQEIGLVAVGGKSYVTFGDKALEQKGANKLGPEQIADFIRGMGANLTNVKKTADNTYSAEIDVKKLIAEDKKQAGGGISKLSIPGIGSGAGLEKTLGRTTVTVTVDDAGYASKMDINLTLSADGSQGGLRATVELSEINQPQKIAKPKKVVRNPADLGGLGAALSSSM